MQFNVVQHLGFTSFSIILFVIKVSLIRIIIWLRSYFPDLYISINYKIEKKYT